MQSGYIQTSIFPSLLIVNKLILKLSLEHSFSLFPWGQILSFEEYSYERSWYWMSVFYYLDCFSNFLCFFAGGISFFHKS